MVAHADVELVMLAQPIGGLVARSSGRRHVDQHLQPVEVVGGLHAEQLVVEHLDVGD